MTDKEKRMLRSIPDGPWPLRKPEGRFNLVQTRFLLPAVGGQPGTSWCLDQASGYRREHAMGFLDSEAQSAVDLIAWRLGDNDKTWSERVQSALLWGISYSEVLSDMCLLPCGDAWRVDGSDEEIFEAIVDDPDELPDDVRRMVLRLVRIPFEPLIAVENRIEKGGEHTEINHAALEQRLDGNCSNDLRTYWRN